MLGLAYETQGPRLGQTLPLCVKLWRDQGCSVHCCQAMFGFPVQHSTRLQLLCHEI